MNRAPHKYFWALALLSLVAPAALAAQAAPVAVVIQLNGGVTVQQEGKAAALAAAVGMQLKAGDRITVPSGGRLVLLHRTGRMEAITASTTVQAPRQAQPGTLFDRTVKTLAQVATTDARKDPNRQGMIRPVTGSPVPTEPRNSIAVLETRPRFSWLQLEGAPGYIVQIRRTDGPCESGAAERPPECRPARFQTGATDTVWAYPAEAAALARGGLYEWVVAPTAAGRPSNPQKFRVAAEADAQAVQDGLQQIRAAGLDPDKDGLLLLALVYRNAGLFYEANRVLDRLSESGAQTGQEFHMLRGEVYNALGDLEAAAREFQRAGSGS